MRYRSIAQGILASSPWLVAAWLAVACQSGEGGDGLFGGQYHPDGFAAAEAHGPEMKLGGDDCRGCHGMELEGTVTAPSCDGCHTPAQPTAWRSDCTFCHGGELDETGAPPGEIEGADADPSFVAHTAHVNSQMMSTGFDCKQCHVKAVDVLSPGHIFEDITPGKAEVDMGTGLSPRGAYDGDGCQNLYCHGSGRADDGAILVDAPPQTCTSCHAGIDSSDTAKDAMSGLHRLHVASGSGMTCANCHTGVSDDGLSLTDASLHIDGARDAVIDEPGFTYDPTLKSCTGTCHGVNHVSYGWNGVGGQFHPAGFVAPSAHGTEMELQRQDCRGCHGADLKGGTGQSCDNCHSATAPTAWRTDCTFCHGGGLNQTGAPPNDLGSSNTSASQSFVAHSKHVTQGISRASDCTDCHKKPTDVLSLDHAFDDTPGAAELSFTAGRSPAGTYDGNGRCTNLYCHGNGRTSVGVATDGMQGPTCSGCHPRSGMTSNHRGEHAGYSCQECHVGVTTNGTSILAPLLHIDGARDVKFGTATTMTWAPATRRCNGPCHGENHSNETW